jgi:tetratricopeptide (TPR) repeat protein
MNPFDARERRWWNKLRCGRAQESADAAFALSVLLCDRGREDEAEAILSQFSNHSEDSIAAPAAIRLAQLIERGAGPAAAEAAYEVAAARASASQGAAVLIDLAERWVARGETPRARGGYEAIIAESHDPRLRAVASYRLGVIEQEAGLTTAAVSCWESALDDAEGSLYIHLVINLAEALQEAQEPDFDRVEELFEEVIDSDHPDLGPRAAIALAKLKRRHGQLIDAYRLAQLVVDSQHPVFAPEGEAERDRLVGQELDSLLKLPPHSCEQLQLCEGAGGGKGQHGLYLPVTSLSLIPEAETQIHHCYEQLEYPIGRATELECEPGRERLGLDRPGFSSRMAGTFLWRAILGRLDQNDLRTMKRAIQRDSFHIVRDRPYGGSCMRWSKIQRPHLGIRSWSGRDEELEFLIVLQAAAWLRKQTAPGSEGLTSSHFRFVFAQASSRLVKLLNRGESDSECQPGVVLLQPRGWAEQWTQPFQAGQNSSPTAQSTSADLAEIYAPARRTVCSSNE